MMGCKGSLKEVNAKDLKSGYAKAHLKSMYGIAKPVTIAKTKKFMILTNGLDKAYSFNAFLSNL